MKKCAIIGSGDLGQLIAYHAKATCQYEVAGYFNDYLDPGEQVDGLHILGGQQDILSLFEKGVFEALFVGIGYKHFQVREKLYETFAGKIPFGKMIHPSSYVDPSCSIGEGVVILPGCVLDRNVTLEPNVLLNTGVRIAHDTRIGKHSFLAPGVVMAGFIEVGACCNIGINSTVIDNIKIVPGVQTGGGTVVNKSLSEKGLYVGVPARFVRSK